MQYGKNKKELILADLINLFDMNNKSIVSVYDSETEEELFYGRVDYLQFTENGEMSDLCKLKVDSLDTGSSFSIYVIKE